MRCSEAGPGDGVRRARTVVLAHATDAEGFRGWARALLAQGKLPGDVDWSVAGGGDLFSDAGPAQAPPLPPPQARVAVPAAFVELMNDVLLHSDPARFGLLYRLLWRLVHEPGLRHDALDADRARAAAMARAVRRDIHKMRAFVRFRPVESMDGGPPLHVAWFEPEHHIVEANAAFFARRFAGMRWAILTPARSVRWDGQRLDFGPGADRADAPAADAGEALWLTYYRHIFNPARLKVAAMKKEMPVRYWRNLPEAALISPLVGQAAEQCGRMVEAGPTVTRRRLPGGGAKGALG